MKEYKELAIKVTDLYLDQKNPRFPSVNSQREAIDTMLEDQQEKLIALASDIFQNGLNPSTRLIVFKERNRYIDGDGNRRLTALKILETPSLADQFPKISRAIAKILRGSGEIPTEVDCVVFSNRDAARHWISVNHAGEQNGRGHIDWDSEQNARFEGRSSIGLEALDLLTHQGYITDDDRSKINKSTLDRLLSFKEVKSALSIKKDGENFTFKNVEHLKKVILKLRGKTVDEVYTAAKGKEFIRNTIEFTEVDLASTPTTYTPQHEKQPAEGKSLKHRSRRINSLGLSIFGCKLSLKPGHVNNFYRDIESLYDFYLSNRLKVSVDFIVIIRMSLRMLAETASNDLKKNLSDYLTGNFDAAKKVLDQNTKTTLANQNVKKDTIVQLLQTGAHDFHNSRNEEQAIAISIILGSILTLTHGK